MRILYTQFANSAFKRHEECDGYWDSFYSTNDKMGYWRGKYVFEIPKWIAEIDYLINDGNNEREVFYCEHDISEILNKIKEYKPDYVLFSLMDCNKFFIKDVVETAIENKFIIGGYNEEFLKELGKLPNVTYVETVHDVADVFKVPYVMGTDYSLFKGETVLPRLTLSYGCRNNCKFCIIPHGKVIPIDNETIFQQVASFKNLCFKLVYIDDKTFGQCDNFEILAELYERIKSYNPNFEGFVVQTTSGELLRKYDIFEKIKVKVAEIGMETWNDEILKIYRKPSTENLVNKCVNLCCERGTIKLILNVIVGFPEETNKTYAKTLKNVTESLKRGVLGINPAIYADYDSDDCQGEIDFQKSDKIELHRKWWKIFNNTAKKILDERE
jgi:radical SAM superfamily enzyme YgiQ (UPF0313 family)